ncbi:nucleotide-diphospho-sugar transferase [Victivallis vadensis]|uniref:Nucleotide-diphospho-sugar transferase n=1 Tax=Victivallis vadensis TaxID=172901 RepID=A0A848AT80_9BACT|nr:nucleotide-diphospho-sugar transferase [Victivallis vadensis]NMD85443.1 nucleotide-diphospho-sugar transferase [Victivallis vadensis]
MCDVPVLFVIFNRLETTVKAFEAIRAVQPKRLYIAADGPRKDHPGEAERCGKVRRAVLDGIDWPCRLESCFREENLGCGPGVAAAIDWFFLHEEEGIILEDDCVAHPDFFRFAAVMLERYRDDWRVMHISGDCLLGAPSQWECDYFFTRYPFSWGWATWRRAWKLFDFDMASYPEFKRRNCIAEIFPGDRKIQRRWLEIFDAIYFHNPNFSAWDFQWLYANWCNHALCVCPACNLVTNIGTDSTHLMQQEVMNLKSYDLRSYRTPDFFLADQQMERSIFRKIFASPSLHRRIAGRIHRVLQQFFKMNRKARGN